MRHCLARLPDNVRVGDIAFAVCADCQQARPFVAGADKDQSMPVYRAWNDGITVIAYPPYLFSIGGIVGTYFIAARTDDLPSSLNLDQQRRVEGELFGSFDGA